MAHYCGYTVIDLYRVQISELLLDNLNLPENQFMKINKSDILG